MTRLGRVIEANDRDVAPSGKPVPRYGEHRADGHDVIETNHRSRPPVDGEKSAHGIEAPVLGRHAFADQGWLDGEAGLIHGARETGDAVLKDDHITNSAKEGDVAMTEVDQVFGCPRGPAYIVGNDE